MLAVVVLDVGCDDWVILWLLFWQCFCFFNKMVDFFLKLF